MPNPSQLYDEADKLKDAGDLDGAVAKLLQAVEIDASYGLAYSALAVVEQKRGNHEQAIEHAKKVTELSPDDAFSYTALSVTYQRAYAGMGEMSYIQLAEDAMAKSREVEMQRR
ncbi:MAG: scaffolding protein [Planctomycetota bacterium]